MTSEDKITLINRVSQWMLDNAESWELPGANGRAVGPDLAYLLWAIADDADLWVVDEMTKPGGLVYVLKQNPNGLYAEVEQYLDLSGVA